MFNHCHKQQYLKNEIPRVIVTDQPVDKFVPEDKLVYDPNYVNSHNMTQPDEEIVKTQEKIVLSLQRKQDRAVHSSDMTPTKEYSNNIIDLNQNNWELSNKRILAKSAQGNRKSRKNIQNPIDSNLDRSQLFTSSSKVRNQFRDDPDQDPTEVFMTKQDILAKRKN